MTAHIITITQQKGGAGKTTLAAHLATAFTQAGEKVAVVDIDPQGSLAHWHSVRENRFGEGFTGMHFSRVSGVRLQAELGRLKNNFSIIIIDSPPHTQAESKAAIRLADLALVPVQPSPTDIWATKGTVEICADENIPCKIVLNRVTPNSKLAKAVAKEITSRLKTTLGNRVAFASSLLEGRTVTETHPSSAAAKEVRALTHEVFALLGAKPARKATTKPRAKTPAKKAAVKPKGKPKAKPRRKAS